MRQLTADTMIRIKPERPVLTGDTKIRLSQIKDLAAWVEDRKYQVGQISEKTGLQKQPDGSWKEPRRNQKSRNPQGMATTCIPHPLAMLKDFIKKELPNGVCHSLKEFKHYAKANEYKPGKKIVTAKGIDISNTIREGTKELKEKCGGEFKHILVVNNPDVMEKGIVAEIFKVPPFEDTLLINGNNDIWDNPTKRKKFLIQKCSTKNDAHIFLHEYGHNKLDEMPENWENDSEAAIAMRLSETAASGPDELQSELYAAKKEERTIDKDIIQLYEKYGGKYDSF